MRLTMFRRISIDLRKTRSFVGVYSARLVPAWRRTGGQSNNSVYAGSQ